VLRRTSAVRNAISRAELEHYLDVLERKRAPCRIETLRRGAKRPWPANTIDCSTS